MLFDCGICLKKRLFIATVSGSVIQFNEVTQYEILKQFADKFNTGGITGGDGMCRCGDLILTSISVVYFITRRTLVVVHVRK